MRIDHIENFNLACASVAKLAAEAIAEHRRQIEQIEAIGREAAALAGKLAGANTDRSRPAAEREKLAAVNDLVVAIEPVVAKLPDQSKARVSAEGAQKAGPAGTRDDGTPGDILFAAMRRAEREEAAPAEQSDQSREDQVSGDEPSLGPGAGNPPAILDRVVLARGRELVASFSGKKRVRRQAAG
jgi:hypothetical protein